MTARVPGATEDEPEKPMIRWMERCIAPIKTLPVLRADPNDPNDVDTKGEDHCWDDTMYMCLWRPMKPRDTEEDWEDDDDDDKVVSLASRRKYVNSGRMGTPSGGW